MVGGKASASKPGPSATRKSKGIAATGPLATRKSKGNAIPSTPATGKSKGNTTKPSNTSNKATAKGPKATVSQLLSPADNAEIQRRVAAYMQTLHPGNLPTLATSYPAAYREAVRTKNGESEEVPDDAEQDEEEEAADEDAFDGVAGGGGHDDEGEGSEGELSGGILDGHEPDAERGEDLDEEEEQELRTVKGKGKAKATPTTVAARPVRFGGIIMTKSPYPEGDGLSKPKPTEIKELEQLGLAVFDTRLGLTIPGHASFDEVDQILGDLLPTPFEYLRERINDDEPVWELLKAEYRTLYQTNIDRPLPSDIRSMWGDGRTMANRILWICPTIPFSKKILSKWRSRSNTQSEPSAPNPTASTSSRKRKQPSPEPQTSENDENNDDDDGDDGDDGEGKRRRKKLRVESPVNDTKPALTRRTSARRSARESREVIDLTTDEQSKVPSSPLRERQVRDEDHLFLYSSPDKEFDPYTNPSLYFKAL